VVVAAYSFDGIDDYLIVESALATAAPLTFAAWFRPSRDTAAETLVYLGNKAKTNLDLFTVFADGSAAGDPIRAQTADASSGATASSTTGFTSGSWASATSVFASTNSRAAFRDGGSKGTNANSRTPAGIDRFAVGRRMGAAPNFPLQGHIGYVFVWTVALSDTEVSDFHSGTIPQTANLVAFYDLTQNWGAGPVTNLKNPGTYDLTINGATYDTGQTPPVSYSLGGTTHTGSATLPLTLERAAAGTRTAVGTVTAPHTLNIGAAATRTALSTVATAVTFAAATAGIRATTGTSTLPLTLTFTTGGAVGETPASLTVTDTSTTTVAVTDGTGVRVTVVDTVP
jgi:hypothetical protein